MSVDWSFPLNLRWSIHSSIPPSVHPYIVLSIFVCLFIHPSKSLLVHPSVHPSHISSICPSINLSIHLPVYSSFPLNLSLLWTVTFQKFTWSLWFFLIFFTCQNSDCVGAQGRRNVPESPHFKVKNAAIFDTVSESDELMSRNWIVCIIAGSSCAEAITAKPGTRAQLKNGYCPFETSAAGRLEGCCEREKDTPSLSLSVGCI